MANYSKNIAYRFYSLRDFCNARIYFLKAKILNRDFLKSITYGIQSKKYIMKLVNPKWFDLEIIKKIFAKRR